MEIAITTLAENGRESKTVISFGDSVTESEELMGMVLEALVTGEGMRLQELDDLVIEEQKIAVLATVDLRCQSCAKLTTARCGKCRKNTCLDCMVISGITGTRRCSSCPRED